MRGSIRLRVLRSHMLRIAHEHVALPSANMYELVTIHNYIGLRVREPMTKEAKGMRFSTSWIQSLLSKYSYSVPRRTNVIQKIFFEKDY